MLQLYCDAVGIDFQDSMAHWPPLDQHNYAKLEEWKEAAKVVLESTGIWRKPPTTIPDVQNLPLEVQDSIQENLPLYEMLYAKRLRLPEALP